MADAASAVRRMEVRMLCEGWWLIFNSANWDCTDLQVDGDDTAS